MNLPTIETHLVASSDGVCAELRAAAQAQSDGAVVLCLPALGIAASYYDPLLVELAQAGFRAACMELRGNGTSSVRASWQVDFGYADLVQKDMPATLARLSSLWPGAAPTLLGHSLGGQLAVLFASEATTFCSPADPRASTPVAGIVMVAAGMPYFACWPARAAATIAVGSQLAALTARLLGYFPGQSLGFGQREARTLMRDWALTARSGRYALRGAHFDYERALAGVELPILSVALERDEMSPPRAVEHLLAKMPRARITRWSYLPADGNPVSHNRWPRQPRAIVARIAAWHEGLSSRVQSAPRGENVSPIPRP